MTSSGDESPPEVIEDSQTMSVAVEDTPQEAEDVARKQTDQTTLDNTTATMHSHSDVLLPPGMDASVDFGKLRFIYPEGISVPAMKAEESKVCPHARHPRMHLGACMQL
jgi:hypothetical protein